MNTTLKSLGIVALVFIGLIAGYSLMSPSGNLGMTIHNRIESFDEGIQVDGLTVMDGSGAFTFRGINTNSGNCAT